MMCSLVNLHEWLVKSNFLEHCHNIAFEFYTIKLPCLYDTMNELEEYVLKTGGNLNVTDEELEDSHLQFLIRHYKLSDIESI